MPIYPIAILPISLPHGETRSVSDFNGGKRSDVLFRDIGLVDFGDLFCDNEEGFTYIYGLVDPVSDKIRYIGKSIRPFQRYTNHLNDTLRCHRTNWIRSLLRDGRRPILVLLDKCDNSQDWRSLEVKWIAHGRESGWSLVNETDGGDGIVNISEDARQKMIKTWTGRKHTPETLALMSRNRKGRKANPETRELMSRKMKGRIISESHRDKIAVSNRKFSDDQVASIKQRLDSGEKAVSLAIEFDVSRSTIFKMKFGTYFDRARSCTSVESS